MGWITSENGLRAILGKTVYSKFKAVFDACCGGISTEGDPNKFLNQQGEFVTGAGGNDAWKLTGNAGTNPNTNFIGTTDVDILNFKVNNLEYGYFDSTKNIVSQGYLSAYQNSITASEVVAIGTGAAYQNTKQDLIAIGNSAGYKNSGSGSGVVSIGFQAGFENKGIDSNFIGYVSGAFNEGGRVCGFGHNAVTFNEGSDVIGIGSLAASQNTGDNVIALGSSAGVGNSLSGMFIISNSELPSYLDYTAASAAISLMGIPGNTYLYHDQTTNSIGAVRL